MPESCNIGTNQQIVLPEEANHQIIRSEEANQCIVWPMEANQWIVWPEEGNQRIVQSEEANQWTKAQLSKIQQQKVITKKKAEQKKQTTEYIIKSLQVEVQQTDIWLQQTEPQAPLTHNDSRTYGPIGALFFVLVGQSVGFDVQMWVTLNLQMQVPWQAGYF